MRFAKKRDSNEGPIFSALQSAGRDPYRFTDFDIGAKHVKGHGLMLEVKTAKGDMRAIQLRLKELFGDKYQVVRTPEAALAACGIKE
jgi:hypothetical protein